MMVRLRVELADRPGALARLAGVLAAFRGDIVQVTVMHRVEGIAVDDVWMTVPDERQVSEILEAVPQLPGVRLVGARLNSAPVELDAHLDLLGYLFAAPQRGLEAFIDMLPPLVDADWALVRTAPLDGIHHLSPGAPRAALDIDFGIDVATVTSLPLGRDASLVVGRQMGLPWHPVEVRRLASLLELGVQLVRSAAGSTGQPVTEVTDWLVRGREISLAL
jgi:hypothetical protein